MGERRDGAEALAASFGGDRAGSEIDCSADSLRMARSLLSLALVGIGACSVWLASSTCPFPPEEMEIGIGLVLTGGVGLTSNRLKPRTSILWAVGIWSLLVIVHCAGWRSVPGDR
jgi:hypothetical protein